MVTPDRCLFFPSVNYIRRVITKHSVGQSLPIVVDCTYVYGADYTAAKAIESLAMDFKARGQPLFFFNVRPSICEMFEGLRPTEFTIFYKIEDIDALIADEFSFNEPKEITLVH